MILRITDNGQKNLPSFHKGGFENFSALLRGATVFNPQPDRPLRKLERTHILTHPATQWPPLDPANLNRAYHSGTVVVITTYVKRFSSECMAMTQATTPATTSPIVLHPLGRRRLEVKYGESSTYILPSQEILP